MREGFLPEEAPRAVGEDVVADVAVVVLHAVFLAGLLVNRGPADVPPALPAACKKKSISNTQKTTRGKGGKGWDTVSTA